MDHWDQSQQVPQPGVDILPGSTGMPAGTVSSPPNYDLDQAQHFQCPQQQQLQTFWANQILEMNHPTIDFKSHGLPLTRIKKIMKAEENVCMISADAPFIFAKACDMFIKELTLRSWIMHMEENKSQILLKNDIAAAISKTQMFDFLVDIIPKEEMEECTRLTEVAASPVVVGSDADGPPYYYVPPQNQASLP